MKFLSFTLAIYLLCLSVLPCSDKQNTVMKEEVKISALILSQHDQHGADACTPFCNCSCCAASVSFQPLTIFSFPKIEDKTNYLLAGETFVTYNDKSIWQPPQLS